MKFDDISVVVQGAIDAERTFYCLKSIRKYLPRAEIILSTWENSHVNNLDYDLLLLNQDPGGFKHDFALYNISRSMNNFNRQLVSSKSGISAASRKYCLKLRSDLILNNSNFLNYWDKFNIRDEEYKIFKHRVFCSSIYSREYSCQGGKGFPTPFHPSDFWLFGLTEDIKDYFVDCRLQNSKEGSNWNFKYPNRCPYVTPLWRFAPEQFFCVNWAKKYYPKLQFEDWSDWNPENIELSNNIIYNNFVFLGLEESGIFSEKHFYSEKSKNNIQGLITYQHFQEQYQHYCDISYTIDKSKRYYKSKLIKHFKRLLQPFFKIKGWLSEIFSVLYYFIAFIFTIREKK